VETLRSWWPDPGIARGIAAARAVMDAAVRRGMNAEACLAGTGLDAARIADDGGLIGVEQELRLVRNVVAGLPQALGLALEAGTRLRITDFGMLGLAVYSSANLREALLLLLEYLDLAGVYGVVQLSETATQTRVRLDYGWLPPEARHFLAERDAAAIHRLTSCIDRRSSLRRMRFACPRPPHAEALQAAFGLALEFGAECNEFVADAEILRRPLPQANAATARACAAACRELLHKRRAQRALAARVRALIRHTPALGSDMEAAAAKLCLTVRTLRRRLAEEGTGFRELRDEVLMQMAEEMIAAGNLGLAEVADELGYADVSGFSHAFKRSRGAAPANWRT
jgi:AraC-like DNA-binding protein